MRPTLLFSLLLAAPAWCQWDTVPFGPGDTVLTERFHLLHQSGPDLSAFSAMTQQWRYLADLSASGTYAVPAIQTGHFISLMRLSPSTYRAYSARLGVHDDISFTDHPEQIPICVNDDVALIVGHQDDVLVAAAFSGQHGRWEVIALEGYLLEMICDRFVGGVLTTEDHLYGFSARQGVWSPTSVTDCANLEAKGNVLVARREGIDGSLLPVLAFSGVLGTFAMSPDPDEDSPLLVRHNVAAIVAETGGGFGFKTKKACAYSAYSGSWRTSGSGTFLGTVTLAASANVVRAELSLAGMTSEVQAIGAWPATAWDALPGAPMATGMAQDELVVELDPGEYHAFSGVRGGLFRPRTLINSGTIYVHIHHAIVRTPGGHFHAFSPMRDAWATPLTMAGAALHQGGEVAVVEDGLSRQAYSARENAWIAGPAMGGPGAIVAVSNSTYADLDAALIDAATFVERTSSWALLPAGPFAVPPGILADGNVQLLDATASAGVAGLYGYSTQRAQWDAAPGFAGVPAGAPTVSGNVAWAVDAAGTLHAFATPQAIHSMYQYPLDSEFQTGAPGAASAPLRASLRANPGEVGLYLYAVGILAPPLLFPGGALCIDWFAIGAPSSLFGVIDADGLAEVQLALPAGLAFHQFQTQGVAIDPAIGSLTITQCPPEPAVQF